MRNVITGYFNDNFIFCLTQEVFKNFYFGGVSRFFVNFLLETLLAAWGSLELSLFECIQFVI